MSTKDLLDRLESNKNVARQLPRASEAKPVEAPKGGDTRVGGNVVRRRGAAEIAPPPPPPVATRTILRKAPPVAAAPVASPEPAPTTLRRPLAPATSSLSKLRPEPVETPAKEVAVVAPVVHAPPPAAEPVPEPAVVVPADEAPVSVVVAPVHVEPVVEVAPEPEPVARPVEPAAQPTSERAVIVDRPGGSSRLPAMPSARMSPGGRLPDSPILPGLGKGVISLPAGYDPTDPTGAKRRAREQASQGARWGPNAAPADRRVGPPRPEGAGAGDDARNKNKGPRRGGRSEHLMSDIGEGRHRRKQSKGKLVNAQPKSLVKRKVRVDGETTVANLAHELGVKAPELIKMMMAMGQAATVNQAVDFETASILASELGHEVVNVAFDEAAHMIQANIDVDDSLPHRPPVITVMGHVDHGKTTLLDAIRKAKVAAGEAGGITQHIGAYQVTRAGKLITFIDTPGHAAFSAMRARGARATDIVILVVAADDGVMPQTIEAINHAKAADVPIVVAVNKCDKPGVNPQAIRRTLMEHGLVSEEFGGDNIFVDVSALKGTGIDELLDNVLIVAEVEDLRANPERHAEGVVIESRVETGRGAVASLLVKTGTLRQGDTVVIGTTWGRVRAMSDDRGGKLKEAGPSTPVEIFGLQEVPSAGDDFVVVETEKDARTLSEHRATAARAGALGQRQKMTIDDLYKKGGDDSQRLHVVLKTDVGGSLEAIRSALEAIAVGGADLKILHAAVGPVNESDVNLASANGALIVAFNVKADAKARQAGDQNGVEIKRFDIIYQVLDDVKSRLLGLLPTIYEEQKVGEAEVRAVFNITKFGPIAGCMVTDGRVARGSSARIIRDGKLFHSGKLTGLKRFKEDVKEVVSGFECGIGVDGYAAIEVGDRIELFVQVEVKRVD